jgi:glycosyltransferase involved in cell wall biosynthesis
MKSNLLIHAWNISKFNNNYYIKSIDNRYLNEIKKHFFLIYLLSSINNISENETKDLDLIKGSAIKIIELPFIKNYISSIKYFYNYFIIYKNLVNVDTIYVRYPVPFGWLSKLFHNDKNRIIHFVGYSLDVIKSNTTRNYFFKILILLFYIPEFILNLWSTLGAKVFSNGRYISNKLIKYGIKSEVLVSSTLYESDFYYSIANKDLKKNLKLIFIGSLFESKRVDIVLLAFKNIQKIYPNSILTIVGHGNFDIFNFIKNNDIANVNYLGFINDRNYINELLRTHDIFCFASVTEGSPRVILEAMASGLAVVSTPVGSLPFLFESEKDIIYFDFNNIDSLVDNLNNLIKNPALYESIRYNAFLKIKDNTIEKYISRIFHE